MTKSDAHIEHATHLVFVDLTELLQPGKDGRLRPRVFVDVNVHVLGQNSFQVFRQPTAGDMGDTVDDILDLVMVQHLLDGRGVDARGFEQDLLYRLVRIGQSIMQLSAWRCRTRPGVPDCSHWNAAHWS